MKINAILILFVILCCSCKNLRKANLNINKQSYLNYSNELGLFRDLTREEIVNYYYNSSSYRKGLKNEELLIYLQEVISNGHMKVSYAQAWKSNWQYFVLLDRDWINDPLTQEEIDNTTTTNAGWKTTNVLCLPLYTDPLIFKNPTESLVDREHIWPKSRGFKNKYEGDNSKNDHEHPYAATDMQNLHMGDRKNNQNGHGNTPYGNVVDKNSAIKITSSTTNEVTGYVGLNKYGIEVYEPRDIDKGDIARALFYMATRYHNFESIDDYEPALKLITYFYNNTEAERSITVNETKVEPATYGILEDLLEWNRIDPVDEHEIHRNNLCYNIIQGNRNPYIDFPEWADIAFGESEMGIDLFSSDGLESNENAQYNIS